MSKRAELGSASIRSATAKDAEQIAALCDQLGYPTSPDQARRRLKKLQGWEGHEFFVAQLPTAKLAGWVHVFLRPLVVIELSAEIGGLVVDQNHRGQGIGGLLMRSAEDWSRSMGCHSVRLRCNIIRTEAHTFYQSNGYEMMKTSLTYVKAI
jgi:GNAT superfamily N-acetyltransferase